MRVVPHGQQAVRAQADVGHFGVWNLNAGGVVAREQGGFDDEACLGFRCADEVEYRFVAFQGLAGPILADFAEEAMLDGIPLRSSRGVVANRDLDAEAITESGMVHRSHAKGIQARIIKGTY